MDQWAKIRRRVLVDGVSKRQIIRETGMHWQTLEKILTHSEPPGYRRKQPYSSKLDAHIDWVKSILESDKSQPRKQRHTAKRIFDRLKSERRFDGGYSIVKELVLNLKRTNQEVFMPLDHPPGEAQVDYFQALANINGVLQKVHCFAMSLPHSDMFFVKAYPRECTESFWDGHVQAFNFFGGVPNRISYDNSRIAIRKITGCHQRVLTEGFLQLQSHYLFVPHFCTVRRPNEKGVVENIVRYARSNFMVPVPQVKSFDHLNEQLWESCFNEQHRTLRGKGMSKLELWLEDDQAFLETPTTPFDPCRKSSVIASSLSLLRYKTNDYSVPTRYGHHELTVKAYIDTIKVYTKCGKKIAQHDRLWSKGQISYNPMHYLQLLTDKPGALDYAHPFKKLNLPDGFDLLRKKREAQLPDKIGQRCAKDSSDYATYLLRLVEREVTERQHRAMERRIKAAKFPVIKTIDSFNFKAQPSIKQALIKELLVGEFIDKAENVILIGNSGTGKTHLATALGFAACSDGRKVRFYSVTKLVTQLLEKREERQLERFQKQLEKQDLLILDELGYVPFTKAGAELLFEVVSRAYERTSLVITTNLPFAEWIEVTGNERLTGAMLDRLTHKVHIIEANGESYRLKEAKTRQKRSTTKTGSRQAR